MRERSLALALTAMLLSRAAHADPVAEPRHAIAIRPTYLVLGGQHLTGGVMPVVEGTYAWPVSPSARVLVGAEFGVNVDVPRWMVILGGPIVAIAGQPWRIPIDLRAALHLDAGRLPMKNAWGLPMNYAGLFPGASFTAIYAFSPRVLTGAFVGVRRVNTWSWDGWPVEGGVTGTMSW